MQLFATDEDLDSNAQNYCDARLRKIIVEAAQISSTALWMNDCGVAETAYARGEIYLPTHEHHPLCIWAAQSRNNYLLCVDHGIALCDEYRYRFDKVHATENKLFELFCFSDFIKIGDHSPQPNATTHHKHIPNLDLAYQMELCYKWEKLDSRKPTFTKRNAPKFYKGE